MNDFLSTEFTLLAISQLILLGTCLAIGYRRFRLAQLLILFCICLGAYLLSTLPGVRVNPWLSFLLSRIASATPAVLWLFAFRFFVDDRKIPAPVLALILGYWTMRAAGGAALLAEIALPTPVYLLTFVIPQFVMIGFAFHAIYLGIVGRENDLVEDRRQLRIPFVIVMGILNVWVLGSGFLLASYLVPTGQPSDVSLTFYPALNFFLPAAIFLATLSLNLTLVKLQDNAVTLLSESPVPAGNLKYVANFRKPNADLVQRIIKVMSEEHAYRQMGFTIGDLADAVSIPDHRLRKIINRELHFQNFNQFLNKFRIDEATRLLVSNDDAVSKIALDVGFASLSSFNKAFKEMHGIPPREFRVAVRIQQDSQVPVRKFDSADTRS